MENVDCMTPENFSSTFIDSCISQGITSPLEICSKAQVEIDAIEQQFKAFENLKIKQNDLKIIIKQFGGNEPIKRAKRPPMISDSSEEIESYLQLICIKICELIETTSEKLTPYQIRDTVVSLEDHAAGYAAIKTLCERGILQRNQDGKNVLIVPGIKWNDRPISKE